MNDRRWIKLSERVKNPAFRQGFFFNPAGSHKKYEVFNDRGEHVYHAKRSEFFEDFLEVAQATWTNTAASLRFAGGGTNGTQAIVAGLNGIAQLDTTATSSRTSTLTFAQKFSTGLAPTFETRVATDALSDRVIEAGFYVDANDCLMFRYDSAVGGNILLVSENNNGGEVVYDTGVAVVAGTYVDLRIEIDADLGFRAYINGERVLPSFPGTIREKDAHLARFLITNKAKAQSNKLDIDYIYLAQDR